MQVGEEAKDDVGDGETREGDEEGAEGGDEGEPVPTENGVAAWMAAWVMA